MIDAAFEKQAALAEVFWATLETGGFSPERRVKFPITGDGEFREYRVRLADSREYRGAIVQLRIDPPEGRVRIRGVRLGAEK